MSSSTTVSRLHRIRNADLIASVLYHSLLPLSTLQVTQIDIWLNLHDYKSIRNSGARPKQNFIHLMISILTLLAFSSQTWSDKFTWLSFMVTESAYSVLNKISPTCYTWITSHPSMHQIKYAEACYTCFETSYFISNKYTCRLVFH